MTNEEYEGQNHMPEHCRLIAKKIGLKIQDRRIKKNATIEWVAKETAIPTAVIRRIEAGKSDFLITTLIILSEYLEVDIETLFE